MRVEIVSTGDELVLGEIADTNAAEIASLLVREGLSVSRVTVVGDDTHEISAAYREALARADTVIATGGLGPTEDDLAREALARAMGAPLEERADAVRAIEQRRGRKLLATDRRQATAPRGADLIANPRGSAPGLRAVVGGKTIYVLPGVPHEMRGMLTESVLPQIVASAPRQVSALRHLLVYGLPEAEIAQRLSGLEGIARGAGEGGAELKIGTCARAGVITVRVWAAGAHGRAPVHTERLADEAVSEVRVRLGEAVVGEGDPPRGGERALADLVAEEALAKGFKLAVAESCTGGMIAAALVAVPGMSAALLEGVVAYSNEAKVRRLGVPDELIRDRGAVSEEVARAMAEGSLASSGADVSVAVTGIAGPGGGTEAKPVGLVHVAAASAAGTESVEKRFRGARQVVRERATQAALWLLLKEVRRAARA